MLVKLLDEKGMTEDEISNCIISLWDTFSDPNVKCCQDLNLKMREDGWQDFELDDKVFKILSSMF
jgi:transcription initiation factor IIF auxiliary subunit